MYTQAFAGAGRPPQPITFSEPIDVGAAYVTPPQGRVFFVCGDGTTVTNLDDQYTQFTTSMERRRFASVALALAECKASRGDVIFVHPGHTENLGVDAWPFVAGVKIIGMGQGDTRPTFTFTLALSTLLLDTTGISIQNCRFLVCGPKTGVTGEGKNIALALPILVSGEGCSLIGNELVVGYDAYNTVTLLCAVRANNFAIIGNDIRGYAVASPVGDGFVLAGDTNKSADGFTAIGNTISMAMAAATTGVIANATSTGTANRIRIEHNRLHNSKADSSAVISLAGNSVTTGWIRENAFRVEDNASVQGIVSSGTGIDVSTDNNRIQNVKNETAKQNQGTASA